MSRDAVREILASLKLFKVCLHVVWRPTFITCELPHVFPVAVKWFDRDHGIVLGATTQGACARVVDTKRLRACGRTFPDVFTAVGLLPNHFGVSLLAGLVGIMRDKIVPLLRWVLDRLEIEGWNYG
jgi:hypothetical protein